MEQDYIKLIFGLKLKQIRTDKKLSLFGLSKLSGLSKSYLNEIEKGKKYPKPDKIAILSEKLDVPYDHFVSLKLDKNLAPIGDLLRSKVLKEIPLELFGIKESNLIDIVSKAPAKVNAFISTIIEIAQNYNFSRENFYLASVRSFQEANNNYFDDLEQQVVQFAKSYQIDLSQPILAKDLEEILVEELAYTINNEELNTHNDLDDLRSVFIPKTKTLLLANHIDDAQRAFIYAKELAYNFLEIKDRLYTFPWIKFENFDQVLNNFYASYFAGALIIPRKSIVEQLTNLFNKTTFNDQDFLDIIQSYNASPESVYQRLTNIVPKDFNLQNLFFLRFNYKKGTNDFRLTKELHLSHQHSPRANEVNEKYCRRWVSLEVLKDIEKEEKDHVFGMQISNYPEYDMKYLVFSSATKDPFKENQYRSITIGLLMNKQLLQKLHFINDPKIATKDVGVTCERCAIADCELRQSAPKVLEKMAKNQNTANVVKALSEKFGG